MLDAFVQPRHNDSPRDADLRVRGLALQPDPYCI